MSRHPDTRTLGRSERVPFVAGEEPSDRHHRRLQAALRAQLELETWLAGRGLALRIANDGHHWQVLRAGRQVVEWWPSTAKVVILKKWNRGIHCHDVDQLRGLIAKRLPVTPAELQTPNAERLARTLRREQARASAEAKDDRRAPVVDPAP